MTEAWHLGMKEAAERRPLYDDMERLREYNNAIQAYEDIPAVEPAISYLVGYASQLR